MDYYENELEISIIKLYDDINYPYHLVSLQINQEFRNQILVPYHQMLLKRNLEALIQTQ